MNKLTCSIWLSALAIATSNINARADFAYSNAVVSLNPVAYWPLDEATAPPHAYIATNSGTLGAQANGYYNNAYYPNGVNYDLKTLFSGPVAGATSDGDAAAQFNGGANGDDNSGYVLIPDLNQNLNWGGPFTVEAWVKPGGGDPNTNNSYASTEWAGIIKKGGGGAFYTESGDANGNTYGWTVAMAGIYALGAPDGWYGGVPYPSPLQLETNACWVVDFYNGANGNTPSLEFDVPLIEPTPQWFHLVLTFDGTDANFYVNGELAASTVPNSLKSTNEVFAPDQGFPTSTTGVYEFTTANGVGYAPDTINPMCIGNLNESYSIINQGYPQANAIGFNCQDFNGAVDEVAVYTNALSAATVSQHYNDATASNPALYTNDVLSAHPPVYLRFDEPAYVEPPPNFSTYPVATNYGSFADAGDGLYQPGVIPGSPGAAVAGFGPKSLAVQFNGLDAAVDVGQGQLNGTALDPQGAQPFTVTFWFKANPADCYGRFQTILGRGDQGWRSSIDGSGHLHWNPGSGPEINTSINYNDGAWHQVVGVSDGSTASLYVDGQLSTSSGGVGSLGGSVWDLLIGGAPDYTTSDVNYSYQRYFAGAVTQVAFFDSALNAAQVQTLYYAAELAASISRNPQSTTIGLGVSGSLSVTAGGTPTLSYQWYQGATALHDVAGNILGSATATLTITNAVFGNGGDYTVVAANSFGSVTSAVATVTISGTPTIVTQPSAGATLYAGNQIGFGLTAVGAIPLTYQWFKNGSLIVGASATNLVVTALAGVNTYECVVANSYGSATSTVAKVTGDIFVTPPALVVNFAVTPGSVASDVYNGQGAFADSTNNLWNPFPAGSGLPTGLASTSRGIPTLVTATLNYGFNNGAGGNTTNGTPSWLMSYEDAVNSSSPGIGTATAPAGQITINDLPPGAYNLFIYSANYDGDRGSVFTIAPVNGGTADGGITGTINGSVIGLNAIRNGDCSFVEGDNYVLFTGVTTDPTGAITVTYVPNPNGDLTGEAPFNGVQIVGGTLPTIMTIQTSSGNAIITWTPSTGTLQSAASVNGPFTTVSGATSPYTAPLSAAQQFFRVKAQ